MIVDSIMTRDVIALDASASVLDAARRMRDARVGSLVVTIRHAAAGIVTERDLVQRVIAAERDASATPLRDVMSRPLRTIKPTATVEEAAAAMSRLGVKRLVVILEDDVRGIVTATDVAYAAPENARRLIGAWFHDSGSG